VRSLSFSSLEEICLELLGVPVTSCLKKADMLRRAMSQCCRDQERMRILQADLIHGTKRGFNSTHTIMAIVAIIG
jgi:hypothetical protein